MKFTVMVPVWGREDVFEIFAAGIRRVDANLIAGGHTISVVVVGSQGERSRAMAARNGFDYIEANNRPFPAKLNAGAMASRHHSPDYVCMLGSDNLISDTLLTRAIGFEFAATIGCYFVNLLTRKSYHWRGYSSMDRLGEPIGPGRIYSAELLDRLRWSPWGISGSGRWADQLSWKMVKPAAITSNIDFCDSGNFIFDLKSEENLTAWHYVESDTASKELEYIGAINMLSDSEKDLIVNYGIAPDITN